MKLVWYDPKLSSKDHSFLSSESMKSLFSTILEHTDMETFFSCIKSVVDEKIFLIISGQVASLILPEINHFEQLDRVFILCENRDRYLAFMRKFAKIADVSETYDHLQASIQKYLRLNDKQSTRFVAYDQRKKVLTSLSEQMAEFLWFQLYHDVVLQLPHNDKAKQEMIAAGRNQYRHNPDELKSIDEFEKQYTADAVIKWYTRETFVYKMVNEALRTADIKQLHTFRFYITDLSLALAREHRRREESIHDKINVVYRGVRLTLDELEHIQMCEGNLLSFNGYLSTSRSRRVALSFAEYKRKDSKSVPVLFEIECDTENCQSSVFADISNFSSFQHEEEVLFDIGVVFHVQKIVRDDQLSIVHMIATDEGKELAHEYIEETKKELDMESVSILLGSLLIKRSHYEEARIYFRQLLDNPGQENLVHIHNQLGLVYYHQACFYRAIEHFDKANILIAQAKRDQWRKSIEVLCNMARVFIEQGQYEKALILAKESKDIVEKATNASELDVAYCLYHIAASYLSLAKSEEALDYYKQTLEIRRLYLPESHVFIAQTKHGIGLVYRMNNDIEQAYKFFIEALEQFQTALPEDHPDIANILHDIAECFYKKGHIDKSLHNYQLALEMKEKYYHCDHPSIARTLNDLAIVFAMKGEKQKALKMCARALQIREHLLPFEHPDLLNTYIQMARRYEAIQDYRHAEEYFQKASEMQEKYFPKHDRERAKTAQNLKRLRLVN